MGWEAAPIGDWGPPICRAGGRSRPRSPSSGYLIAGRESEAPDTQSGVESSGSKCPPLSGLPPSLQITSFL